MSDKPKSVEDARVGHAHLKVADLERAVRFYRDVIGMDVTARYGAAAAFLSFGGYHHHLGLNTWHSRGGTAPPAGHTGLYHVALLFPDRAALGRVILRLLEAGYDLTGAADHGVSEAVYLDDPDGNGLELYRDRDPGDWPRDADGALQMVNERLDIDALVEEGRASLLKASEK
ncbi:catechol 2,3-dioxygenase [Roseovarius nanhaiticus]|uniref:Catechol 2,3-dioxygenase n=1 Tax=Roseovarius nanhaiticus TaxID=573024 RepID=A0A1N7HG95_9RHOB|nr:VOC family protein [Roseovarius nanhaiticus]SEK97480.1 catechol 2,3-dioxygenase [Roseovarius nanhaiticus]SIS23698.1 catechol 2,3-dioxygenase [Roseovarius nanhaiticus]